MCREIVAAEVSYTYNSMEMENHAWNSFSSVLTPHAHLTQCAMNSKLKLSDSHHPLSIYSTNSRRDSMPRKKPLKEVDSNTLSLLSSASSESDVIKSIISSPNHPSSNVMQDLEKQRQPSTRRHLQTVIPSPVLDESLHTEAEYKVWKNTAEEEISIEQIIEESFEHVPLPLPLELLNSESEMSSTASFTGSVITLNDVSLKDEDTDIGPEAITIRDDDPQLTQVSFRKRPPTYLRRHSMSDHFRKVHVLDELLYSIDLEYGSSDTGPQPEILFDNLSNIPAASVNCPKEQNIESRHENQESPDSEAILDSIFAGKRKHSCCKTKRKSSWNAGTKRKHFAQAKVIPRHRPRKIAVVGDMCSGKSALISAYCNDRFSELYVPTILRSCITDADLQGEKVELVVIEVSGREDYMKLRKCAYRKTDTIVLCYPCDSPSSLQKIKTHWVPELCEHAPNVPIVVVGTKKDARDDYIDQIEAMKNREDRMQSLKGVKEKFVLDDVGYELAEAIGAHSFLECSARYREGTRDVFETVAKVSMQKSRRKRKIKRTGDICSLM